MIVCNLKAKWCCQSVVQILRFFIILLVITQSHAWDSEELEIFDVVEEVNDNFYTIMGISQDASLQDVKRAYEKLSNQFHAADAEIKFRQLLLSVYKILRDDSRRARYDRVLVEGLPDWRSPIYYYRRAKKMSMIEISISILTVVISITQYFMAWSSYLDRKHTMEEQLCRKFKINDRRKKRPNDLENQTLMETELNKIPRPKWWNILPVQLVQLIVFLVTNGPSLLCSCIVALKEARLRREAMKRGDEERRLKEEEEKKKEIKPQMKLRKRVPNLPDYTGEAPDGSYYHRGTGEQNCKPLKPATHSEPVITEDLWTEDEFSDLGRLLAKYPGGTADRWEKIATLMNRTVFEVTKMSHNVMVELTNRTIASEPAETEPKNLNMDDFMCPICFGEFGHSQLMPKVLECGHSMCSICLSKTLLPSNDALCPTCRVVIRNKESFPNNYSLLSVSSKCEKILANQKEGEAAVGDLKKEVTNLLAEVKDEMASSCTRMKCLQSTLSRVVELEKFEEKDVSVKRTLHGISDIRNILAVNTVQPGSSETLIIADFQDEKTYLYEVYRKMKSGLVFAIHTLGKDKKYGEVTFLGNKIFVHCLSSSSLPDKSRNVTYVSFQDLKKCWMNLEFGVFLQIPCNPDGLEALVEIELIKGYLSNQYLKLCTGEVGPSYKGVSYEEPDNETDDTNCQDILFVWQYMSDGHLKTGRIDYEGHKLETEVKKDEIIVWIGDDLRFYICKVVQDTSSIYISGRVVSPRHLADIVLLSSEFPKKITDCGVYFNLK